MREEEEYNTGKYKQIERGGKIKMVVRNLNYVQKAAKEKKVISFQWKMPQMNERLTLPMYSMYSVFCFDMVICYMDVYICI